MSQLIVRRRGSNRMPPAGPVALGLALGSLAGFLLGEWLGPAAERAVTSPAPRQHRSMAELVNDAQTALATDTDLAELALEVLPVSRMTVELHGWVSARKLRARAHAVVREAIGTGRVVNCILVRGEDDAAQPTLDILTA